jgi:hypothetical protein
MSDFSATTGHSILPLSNLPAIANRVKHMTMGLGFFLVIFSVAMLLFIGVYTLSILLAVVFFLMGIFGVLAGSRIKARPTPTRPLSQSVLIEVKCKSCNTLNPETSQFCASCGARL